MSDEYSQHQASERRRGRLKWTEDMNRILLDCKKETLELIASSEPPRNSNGRNKGYMSIMKELWEQNSFCFIEPL